jgi:hypothetical protein
VYDGSGSPQPLLVAAVGGGGTCRGKPCWKATGKTGFKYNDKLAAAHGITRLQLKAGLAGKSQVKVQGKGASLLPPNPSLTLPVIVQLLVNDGPSLKCWQTAFTTAAANDDQRFKAKGP